MDKLKISIFFIIIGLTMISLAIDISPSKNQGGSNNPPPYESHGAPSLLKAPFHWIFGPGRSEAMKRAIAPPNFKVDLQMEPKNFTPTSNAVLKARMVVINESKDKYILEFNSAQHYDFLIKSKDGKEFYRSSADKEYSQQISSIVINRKEKLVYEDELFSATNQAVNLPPGQYSLTGRITAKIPISVETTFEVLP